MFKSVLEFFRYNTAVGFGIGHSLFAPGTFGSLAALVAAWLFFPSGYLWQLLWVLVACALGFWSAGWVAEAEGEADPSFVIIDEIAGQLLVFVLLPQPFAWWVFPLGFVLFRLFDIWKPWVIARVEKWPGSWGIMCDDLVAGLFANILLQLILWWF